MKNPLIYVARHTWLDESVSWFLEVGNVRLEGEIHNETVAVGNAKALAKKLNGTYVSIIDTNEIFS